MVVFIHSILQKLRSALKNERGEANYFSTVVFIFIAVVLLAFIIDLFGINRTTASKLNNIEKLEAKSSLLPAFLYLLLYVVD